MIFIFSSTMRVDKFRKAANESAEGTSNQYKGLRVHALEGLHEFVAARVRELVPAGRRVLDIAAGSGALSQRLLDGGYRPSAVDAVPENFRLHGSVPFCSVDLNQAFSAQVDGPFDAILAIEIIEHLENPRSFFRECQKLLEPGGTLFLTTPNLESPVSKALFLRHGTFHWFLDSDYLTEGHITPLSRTQLERCAGETGFVRRWEGSFGASYRDLVRWPRMRLLARALAPLSTTPGSLRGEIYAGAFVRR